MTSVVLTNCLPGFLLLSGCYGAQLDTYFVNHTTNRLANDTVQYCPCDPDNLSDLKIQHANQMKEAILNKTTWLEKAKHRATHSRDAFISSLILGSLMVAILLSVALSQMWKDKNFQAVQQKQPVHYEDYDKKTEVRVKDLLRSRAKSLVNYFSRHGKRPMRKVPKELLQMESFIQLRGNPDESHEEVDRGIRGDDELGRKRNIHQRLLVSSSSSSSSSEGSSIEMDDDGSLVRCYRDLSSSSSEEEDVVFAINKRTGEWLGDTEVEKVLIGSGADNNKTSKMDKVEVKKKSFVKTLFRKADTKERGGEEEVKLLVETSSESDLEEQDEFFPFG